MHDTTTRILNILRGIKLRGYRLGNRLRNRSRKTPDEQYLELVSKQISMRAAYGPTMDIGAISDLLRKRQEEFEGHLVFFAASDFGHPVVFLPAGLENHTEMLNAVLDRIHEQKWQAENEQLRSVRHHVFDEVDGIHQGLAALCYDDGSAEYDIVYGWHGVYNFLTIRQVVGLVDWVTNADERWLTRARIEY
jgi:hypothetical protein